MSSPLAIAAVTAVLKDLLNDGLLNQDLSAVGSFSVTALPPDRITTGQNEPNQLNLFLYQVTPNLGWRNEGLPSRDGKGARLTNPPLALDLHYMLTAYGSQDLNAEVLLGYAMHLLHENPALSRQQLRAVLAGGSSPVDGSILPTPFGNLSAEDLADQLELIKISPVFLGTEDLSKMWTAMQARYRPTMAYLVSVVLIQANQGVKIAPPVLTRGKEDRGPVALASPFPMLAGVRPAVSDLLPAMRLGDDLLVTGGNLNAQGKITALFEHAKTKEIQEITPAPASSPTRMSIHVPAIADDAQAMNQWTIGMYSLRLFVARPDLPEWPTNGVPIALAPLITVNSITASPGDINVTVTCTPRLRSDQEAQVSLILGSQSILPQSITTPADATKPTTLTFKALAVPAGKHTVRLRVDGIDSLPVKLTGSPLRIEFDPQQQIEVA